MLSKNSTPFQRLRLIETDTIHNTKTRFQVNKYYYNIEIAQIGFHIENLLRNNLLRLSTYDICEKHYSYNNNIAYE